MLESIVKKSDILQDTISNKSVNRKTSKLIKG